MLRHFLIVAAATVLAAAGCSRQMPTPTEPAAAAQLLCQTLDQWKNGEAIAEIKAKPDPIIVSELRWEAGWKLERYELGGDAQDGYQARCKASLWLKDSSGRPQKEVAEYVVTTAPKKTVARSSEGW